MTDRDEGQRAWSHFLGAHALVLGAIERRLKAAGHPPIAWYDVLLELERAGGELRIHELAERLVVERYNVTRLLDRMEAAKAIVRRQASDDRRGTVAVLTEAGREQRKAIWPDYRRAIEASFATALGDDAPALTAIMKKLIGHHRA
jgi:DNA-binding MarR family transcriptional regulator